MSSNNPEAGHTDADRKRHRETMETPARRYWAISGIGWGRGTSPDEAVQNYIETQQLNHKHLTEEQLAQGGELGPDVWYAPEGTEGFVLGGKLIWVTADDVYTDAELSQKIEPGSTVREP